MPTKTVRKVNNDALILPETLERVLKMRKSEFVKYMMDNSTKAELVSLAVLLESSNRTPALTTFTAFKKIREEMERLSKEELSVVIYNIVGKASGWTVGLRVSSLLNVIITVYATYGIYDHYKKHPEDKYVLVGAGLFLAMIVRTMYKYARLAYLRNIRKYTRNRSVFKQRIYQQRRYTKTTKTVRATN